MIKKIWSHPLDSSLCLVTAVGFMSDPQGHNSLDCMFLLVFLCNTISKNILKRNNSGKVLSVTLEIHVKD
jgi:hypothetical protein